jgi:serine/threonine protein kinase
MSRRKYGCHKPLLRVEFKIVVKSYFSLLLLLLLLLLTHIRHVSYFTNSLLRSLADVEQKVKNEVTILQSLRNFESIVTLNDVLETDLHYYLVMELMGGGDAFDRILKKGMYPEVEARTVARNLLSSVGYMHYLTVAHRDLKPQNLRKFN